MSALESEVFGDAVDPFLEEVSRITNEELKQRIRALDNEIRIMKSDMNRIKHEARTQEAHIKDNREKIKVNKQLPYLVANIVEIVEPYVDPNEEDGGATDVSLTPEGQGVVVKVNFSAVCVFICSFKFVPAILSLCVDVNAANSLLTHSRPSACQ